MRCRPLQAPAVSNCRCGALHLGGLAYYVTAIDAGRVGYLAGPFADHARALDTVVAATTRAIELDPWAHFYAFGTAALPISVSRRGVLNASLGLDL